MKNLTLTIILFFSAGNLFSQSPWVISPVNVYTNGGNPLVAQFQNLYTGYVLYAENIENTTNNNFVIYKTTNRGNNWTNKYGVIMDYNSTFDMCFIDENTGWVVFKNYYGYGGYNRFAKTTNGGNNWDDPNITGISLAYPNIIFSNANTGYLFGRYSYNNYLYKMTDGTTWSLVDLPSDIRILSVEFSKTNANKVYVAGWKYNYWYQGNPVLIKSDNNFVNNQYDVILNGESNPESMQGIDRISIVNENNTDLIRLVTAEGLYKLENDNTITKLYSSPLPGSTSQIISFSNANTGYGFYYDGTNKYVEKTTNGGYNWTTELSEEANDWYWYLKNIITIGDVAYVFDTGNRFHLRKCSMSLNSMFDWTKSDNGLINVDGYQYSTPALNFLISGGNHNFSVSRANTSNGDTTSLFYYWGGILNGSMNYNSNTSYFDKEGPINADYKSKLRTINVNAIRKASQVKSFVDTNGVTNLCYESMGGIFFSRICTVNGVTRFKADECLSGTNPMSEDSYVTYNNANPYITEIKNSDNTGTNINSEGNVAAAWERREGNTINIIYKERFQNEANTQYWSTPVNQPEITIDNAPSNFYCYPKVFSVKTPIYDHYCRLIFYLKPDGGNIKLHGFVKSHVNNGNTFNFDIDQGDITDFAVKAIYQMYPGPHFVIHLVYKKNGKIYYEYGSLALDGTGANYNRYENTYLSNLDVLQDRGELDITLRNSHNYAPPTAPVLQPVIVYKGQYNVRIAILPDGDGSSNPDYISTTRYSIVYREKLENGSWEGTNHWYDDNIQKNNPGIEGSKNYNSYLINYRKNGNEYVQKVTKWKGAPNSSNLSSYVGTDAKFIKGSIVNENYTIGHPTYPPGVSMLLLNGSTTYDLNKSVYSLTSTPDDNADELNAVAVSDNCFYSFNLGSILVNNQLINFFPENDSVFETPEELNEQMRSAAFGLHENDTLVVGRNCFYLDQDPQALFTEVRYRVNLVNNSNNEVKMVLTDDTVHVGDSIQIEYLDGFVISGIQNGFDSFYVQMCIDTLINTDGDGLGLNIVQGGFDVGSSGGDNHTSRYINWKHKHISNSSLPTSFNLYQNFPNPFNPVTTIKYDLPKNSNVTIIVYDLLGREVSRLVNNEFKNAGRYEINWNANNYASGVYIYRIETGDYVNTKKMVLIK
jgi:hypothetical protein